MLVPTRKAAKKMGVTLVTLQRHIAAKTVDAPELQIVKGVAVRLWSASDIAKARTILADASKPGRKPKAK